jgi:hypothetical protein
MTTCTLIYEEGHTYLYLTSVTYYHKSKYGMTERVISRTDFQVSAAQLCAYGAEIVTSIVDEAPLNKPEASHIQTCYIQPPVSTGHIKTENTDVRNIKKISKISSHCRSGLLWMIFQGHLCTQLTLHVSF